MKCIYQSAKKKRGRPAHRVQHTIYLPKWLDREIRRESREFGLTYTDIVKCLLSVHFLGEK